MVARRPALLRRGPKFKKTDSLSGRALRRRTTWRNSIDRPSRDTDGWPMRWYWKPQEAVSEDAPEGLWCGERCPFAEKHHLSFLLWKRRKALRGLKKWLANRCKLELPCKPLTKKPLVPFKTQFGVGVHTAEQALGRVREPKANPTTFLCKWRPSGKMHCAYYGLFHEVESMFDEQRKLPPHSPGWLPDRAPGECTTLLWSLDHASRTAPIGIWTVKEIPGDCTLQNHHPSQCFVVSSHIGSERKRELEEWHQNLPFFDLVRAYRSPFGPLGPNHRNLLCCDAIAFQKLFDYSPANAYTQSPNKQCCIFCDRTHAEVRQWDVDTTLVDVRSTPFP